MSNSYSLYFKIFHKTLKRVNQKEELKFEIIGSVQGSLELSQVYNPFISKKNMRI
jgi:hypothetical protein